MDTMHLKTLASTDLFAEIDETKAAALLSCLNPVVRKYAKSEIIIRAGDSVQSIGIMLSGKARAYAEEHYGNQTLMANLTPLSVFGEILVSTRTHKSPVTIYAATDVTVAFIEYEKTFATCAQKCSAHRRYVQNLLKVIGDKYFQMFDRINILREKTLRDKILAYLHTLKKGSGNTRENQKGIIIKLPFSKTTLAEYLLANRSALSRELRKMENDGLITVNGRKISLL
ncbi:MAG: Crp/Fnr family transcriptional regulator [Oscillospiraceae bacterium]|nr:Crp/Fnr family transcriptional regulator [Oscillospiraceae bacterium]